MSLNETGSPTAGRPPVLWSEVYAACCFAGAVGAAAFIDRLSAVLLLLSTLLFWAVTRYARRYMAGDPGQQRFAAWLCVTGSCVFGLVLAQNLVFFAAAWCATSLSLHQLLQFYGHRPGAVMAARKKFLISRLGDVSLAGAVFLVWRQFGMLGFREILWAAEQMRAVGHVPSLVVWAGVLLAFAALLKSAQFPFHSWLPDTMETPTPVSALMHAGIINAGGILVIRLSPLISLSEPAMVMLTVASGFTALFASLVMQTQTSIKRALAFSTVAQMGFMMLECGLGAFHVALVHLVAHSMYKAHAFLASGRIVREQARQQQPAHPLAVLFGLCAAATMCLAAREQTGGAGSPVLIAIFGLALAQILWSLWETSGPTLRMGAGILAGAGVTAIYFALERLGALVVTPAESGLTWLGAAVLTAFAVVAAAEWQMPRLTRQAWSRNLWVHARNGFYLNTLANRMTLAIWPVRIYGRSL
jgi:NAD(P)H-quinone oxidoreductase subunit 5